MANNKTRGLIPREMIYWFIQQHTTYHRQELYGLSDDELINLWNSIRKGKPFIYNK